MKQISDAIVIGSGIIGCATAYALTRGGIRRVALIEKGPLVSGMTRRNPGLVHPFHLPPLMGDLAHSSYPLYSQWAVHFAGKSPFVETGAALIASPSSETLFREPTFSRSNGVSAIVELDSNGLKAIYPNLAAELRGFWFTPHAGYCDPVLTAQAMAQAAKERGATIHTGTLARRILVERGQVKGVETTTGTVEAPQVIVAAGGWSDRLLAPLGISLQLRFRRGVALFYEQPPKLTEGYPILLDDAGGFFMRPHPYRMSAAGWTAAEAQTSSVEDLRETISPREERAVGEFVKACLPAFDLPMPMRGHTVLYSAPADRLAVLGRVAPVNGLLVAAGFGTSAFSTAPAVGETIAQILMDGSPARDISALDPLRASLTR